MPISVAEVCTATTAYFIGGGRWFTPEGAYKLVRAGGGGAVWHGFCRCSAFDKAGSQWNFVGKEDGRHMSGTGEIKAIPHSEDDILALLDAHFPRSGRGLLLGRGDDCALLAPADLPRALTCDVFVENSHFRTRYFTPYELGWKALAVNVSDLASAGAEPEGFALGLTLTGRESGEWLDACFSGMADLAGRWHMALAGGDLARADLLHFSVTAWGCVEYADLRRGRARSGDMLFTCGEIGLARAGLLALENAGTPEDVARVRREYPVSCAAHLTPEPRVDFALALAQLAERSGAAERVGLMDLSDGPARDLPRLLDSRRTGLGADVDLPDSALHAEVRRFAGKQGENAAEFAFRGGEDYALIGTCPPELWPAVEALGARKLGEARPGGMTLNGRPWTAPGFDHFG